MKKDWTVYRKQLSKDFRLEHDYERLQVELDAWAAYIESKNTLLLSALHALRSYQYGNSSPELAEEVADKIEKELE
jgi:hypothetical protein